MSLNLKKFLKPFIAAGFLVAFFFYVPVGELYQALLSTNFPVFSLAILLGFPGIFLGTLSTWLLARRQEISIPLSDFFLFNLSLRFYSYFSPASSVATALRWYKLSAGNKRAEALSAIALTRVLSIFVAVSLGLFWAISDVDRRLVNPFVFGVFFALIIVNWLILARVSPVFVTMFERLAEYYENKWLVRLMKFMVRLFTSIHGYARMPIAALALLVFINFVNELLGLLAYILIAYALQIPLSLVDLGWLRAISFLAALAPFTLVGGVGLREVTVILTMSAFNVDANIAGAYSFLIYTRGVIFSLLCGVIELASSLVKR